MAFETVLDQLRNELYKEGFEVGGITDFQNPNNPKEGVTLGKFVVLAVYDPYLYKEMMKLSPFEGIVLPCSISMIELYPGEIAIVPYNPTEQILQGIENPSLLNLATEVSKRMGLAIHALEKEQTGNPDLVTSWS
jgi:uncharacterized protein (DUF302 family)